MNVLVDFARTGRIGPLHCGMPLAEAEDLLGPGRPHPALRMRPEIDGYPYAWGGLELCTTRRAVSEISIRLWTGSMARLPALVLPDAESYSATVLREDLIDGLDAIGCRHDVNDRQTSAGQSSVLTHPANVCAVFFTPGRDVPVPHRERHYLRILYKYTSLPSL
ncbi:hypothetical protein [Streptomyces sp. NPDC090112]|uniref:hypothetical protein n=1 Tax=Streptomyces sp. NPDC090112 TaxID=3365949 RepID=UPI0037FC76A5